MTDINQPIAVHLVGSVPLENSTEVFKLACSLMGQHLNRIPDGETGKRSNWVRWQFNVLANTPNLEVIELSDIRYLLFCLFFERKKEPRLRRGSFYISCT